METLSRLINYARNNVTRIQLLGVVPVILNSLFIILLYYFYQTKELVTIYFSSQLLILNASMLLISISEQFVHFYINKKQLGEHIVFLSRSVTMIFIYCLMIVIFFLIFSEKITLFFFKNYSSSIIYSIELLFRIGLIQVFFYPLSSILKSALICHDKIFIPLIINVIVPLTSLLGLLISFWLGNESMILIVFFQSLVSVLSFLILFIHFRKIFSLNFDPSFSDKEVKGMMINSFSMRFSGSIYTLGNTYLLTSIFGHSSPSVFALYGYIDKMWNALFSAVVTSLQSVGIPKISNLVNKREKKKLDEYCHAYYKSTIGPLLMFFVVLILILSTLLFTELYDLDRSVSVQTVLSLFSVLFLYKLINLFLSVPVIIIQSLRMTYPFLVVNIIIFLLGFMYTIISSNVVGLIAFLTLIEFLSYFYFRIIVKRVFIT